MKKRLLIFLTAFTLLMSVLVVPINAVADSAAKNEKYSSFIYRDEYMSPEFGDDVITVYNSTFYSSGMVFYGLGSPALYDFLASSENIIILLY